MLIKKRLNLLTGNSGLGRRLLMTLAWAHLVALGSLGCSILKPSRHLDEEYSSTHGHVISILGPFYVERDSSKFQSLGIIAVASLSIPSDVKAAKKIQGDLLKRLQDCLLMPGTEIVDLTPGKTSGKFFVVGTPCAELLQNTFPKSKIFSVFLTDGKN